MQDNQKPDPIRFKSKRTTITGTQKIILQVDPGMGKTTFYWICSVPFRNMSNSEIRFRLALCAVCRLTI